MVAPVGERADYEALFSGKKHLSGQNVQVVADLDGRVVDVGDPVNGAGHDATAFSVSGISQRWATHLSPDGPGMLGDSGYQGTGPITPHKKRPGRELTDQDLPRPGVFSFAEHDGGTRATFVSTYATAEALQKVLDMGVIEGASSAINQIDDLVAA